MTANSGVYDGFSFFANITLKKGFPARCGWSFSLSAKDIFQRPPATRWTGDFLKFPFASVIRATEFWQPAGQRIFSLPTPPRFEIGQTKRLFSLCFLLRTKIQNAKRRGRKISLSLTTTIRTGQNGRKWSRSNKKSSKSFSDLLLSLAATVGGWYSVFIACPADRQAGT